MTPGNYIATIRINHARKLLTTTGMKVHEIAEKCGFYDQSHFNRAFRTAYGVPPSAYRRAA